ncbi:hypothetical protein NDU88_013205 [Pleurodeles waltl]|uniref:Uncharacterized protein n=1 Tax=Pleurodeles waltl TaxID=8319 RepID=A0AAV7R824_PLEWA|nr:hypothetical protein NDU88_013205 [Pleurodeles waltl]
MRVAPIRVLPLHTRSSADPDAPATTEGRVALSPPCSAAPLLFVSCWRNNLEGGAAGPDRFTGLVTRAKGSLCSFLRSSGYSRNSCRPVSSVLSCASLLTAAPHKLPAIGPGGDVGAARQAYRCRQELRMLFENYRGSAMVVSAFRSTRHLADPSGSQSRSMTGAPRDPVHIVLGKWIFSFKLLRHKCDTGSDWPC